MNYLVYQLFTSLCILQGNLLESETGSPENLGSQNLFLSYFLHSGLWFKLK